MKKYSKPTCAKIQEKVLYIKYSAWIQVMPTYFILKLLFIYIFSLISNRKPTTEHRIDWTCIISMMNVRKARLIIL